MELRENKTEQIRFMVSESELEQIQMNAKASGRSLSGYLRETALNMAIINIDHGAVTRHTEQITAYKNAINQLIFTIKKTGNYTPVDLEYILEKTEALLKSEKEFIASYNSAVENDKRRISNEVRRIAKKNLK